MKLISRLFGVLAVLFSVASATAQEEGDSLSFEFTMDYPSKYIWRGIEVNDDPVLQPGLSAAYGDFYLGFWGNYDLTDGGREDNFSEYDWYGGYSTGLTEKLSIDLGFIYYYFPSTHGDSDTTEVYVGLAYDCLLSPYITAYYDVDEVNGFYVTAGIGHSFVLTEDEKLTLDLALSIGWGDEDYNNAYFQIDLDAFEEKFFDREISDPEAANSDVGSGFNDLTASAALSYAVNDSFSVYWSINFAELLDSDIERVVNALGDSDNTWTSVGMALAF